MIGATGIPGIWINLGHGSSGWALACGSARVVADLMAGREPEVDIEGLGIERLNGCHPGLDAGSELPMTECAHAAHHARPPLAAPRRRGHTSGRAGRGSALAAAHAHAASRPGRGAARHGAGAARKDTIWIACGPGNNGGDGMEAAMHLRQWGKHPVVTWSGDEAKLPGRCGCVAAPRARGRRARSCPSRPFIGTSASTPSSAWATRVRWKARWRSGPRPWRRGPTLAVDLPSGLDADTGIRRRTAGDIHAELAELETRPVHRRRARRRGQVWFDDLGVRAEASPTAWLSGPPAQSPRLHASHKGSYGDVAVIGGAPGMAGAALLAASAALHAGAGRVFVGLARQRRRWRVDATQPDLMLRRLGFAGPGGDVGRLRLRRRGCGARGAAARCCRPRGALVLDADALNCHRRRYATAIIAASALAARPRHCADSPSAGSGAPAGLHRGAGTS